MRSVFCVAFGGNLRLMVVGSAPLAGNVLTFIRCALGCLVVEGYGQTECTAPITCTVQGDSIPEHVGPPVSCCCVKVSIFIFFRFVYVGFQFQLRLILFFFSNLACRCT